MHELLLSPPTTFCLMIKGERPNLLQYGVVNDFKEIRANTKLSFTLDNVPHSYTIFDLENVLRHPELDANDPGVRALLQEYGRPDFLVERDDKKARGGQLKKQAETPAYMSRVVSAKHPILKSA